ncbi:MAG: PHP domain-containing protein [Bacteroidota bacterium]
MTNKEIAAAFRQLGQLMELHQDNPFKIKSYQNAYRKLRKLEEPLAEMSVMEIGAIPGVGKAISGKIQELTAEGKMATLEKWKAQTPSGVVEMLEIGGFGPKKIRSIWKDLGVESIGELLYAVNENRLVELKGFGAKTQADLKQKLEFFLKSSGQYHFRTLEAPANELLEILQKAHGEKEQSALTGAIRRLCPVLQEITILTTANPELCLSENEDFVVLHEADDQIKGSFQEYPVTIYRCAAEAWGSKQFRYTASPDFMAAFLAKFPDLDFKDLPTETAVFAKVNLPYIAPELRENEWGLQLAAENNLPELLEEASIRGVVHSHSTYSDGINTLADMAAAAKQLGYEYLLITDHSKSAFYANGLKEDRLREQWAEIDVLNASLAPFRILKGIESDILNDGSLDYSDDILAEFDVVIASVHSNLRMDEAKATQRLLTAIANPYTHILGHPTGRLLLSRAGYPIDHKAIIDACAEHRVCIELNANPMRLDLDWSWIPYAIERGVPISINPDAHSVGGIQDVRYGVLAARKGGLTEKLCLNTRSITEFLAWFKG